MGTRLPRIGRTLHNKENKSGNNYHLKQEDGEQQIFTKFHDIAVGGVFVGPALRTNVIVTRSDRGRHFRNV